MYSIVYLYRYYCFKNINIGRNGSGIPTLICAVTFIGGAQLFCTGILGQYLGKTFTEIESRLIYIIKEESKEVMKKC